jgi:hypothetical protein
VPIFRNFETDYWTTSFKQVSEYLNDNAAEDSAVIVWGLAGLSVGTAGATSRSKASMKSSIQAIRQNHIPWFSQPATTWTKSFSPKSSQFILSR